MLRDLVAAWPGVAVLRDGQQYLAPLALTEAIGLGALTAGGWLACREPRQPRARAASAAGGRLRRAAGVLAL